MKTELEINFTKIGKWISIVGIANVVLAAYVFLGPINDANPSTPEPFIVWPATIELLTAVFFFLAYTAEPLYALFPQSRWGKCLFENRFSLLMAFVVAMSFYLVQTFIFFVTSSRIPGFDEFTLLFAGVVVYFLSFITSQSVVELFGEKLWKRLQGLGMGYIAFALLYTASLVFRDADFVLPHTRNIDLAFLIVSGLAVIVRILGCCKIKK